MNYNEKTRFDALSEYLKIPFEDINVPEYSKKNKLLAKRSNGSMVYFVLTEKETQDIVINKFLDEILIGDVDKSFFDLKVKYNVKHLSSSEVEVLYPVVKMLNSNFKNPSKSQAHIFWKLLTGKNDLSKLGLEYYQYLIKSDGRALSLYLGSMSGESFFDYKRKIWILGE